MTQDIEIVRAVDAYYFQSGDYSNEGMHAFFGQSFSHLDDRRRRQMITRCKIAALRDQIQIMEMSDE